MLRSVAAVEQRPWLLFLIVFTTTAVLGFLVQAMGNVYLRMNNDPLVLQYRATLSYTSAVVGDGVPIPLVNVFMTGQLALWRRRPALSEVALSVLGGALIAYSAIAVGVLLCVVPAILMLLGYWPFYYLIIDRKAGVLESFSVAYRITHDNWASAFVLWVMSIGISILGCLALCVGLLFAAPLVSMMFAVAYLMMSGQLMPYASYPTYMPPTQPAAQT